MDEGFRKITLPNKPVSSKSNHTADTLSVPKKIPPGKKRKIFSILFVFLAIFALVAIFVVYRVNAVVSQVRKTQESGKKLAAAIKSQNLDDAKRATEETKVNLIKTQSEYSSLGFVSAVPIIGAYYQDGEHALKAASAGLDALIISIDSLTPYADLLGLKGKGTFTGGTADQRIQTAIVTFEKMIPKLQEVGDKVAIVRKEVDAIDPNRYPEKLGQTTLRSKIVSARDLTDSVTTLFLSARPLLEELPTIMGASEPKRYLVLFQNDKELRPTGGFITAYAIFKLEKGKPTVEKADDIYKLDDSRKTKVGAPPEILQYHKKVYYFTLRDSNISPDFTTAMKQFESLYKDVSDPVHYSGIIAVDTHVLVKAIEILGPFVVDGRTFSAENDPRCNCPKAVYELEDYSTKPVAYVREERKDIIGALLLQIMQKALGVSPGQYWGRLFQMVLSELDQKHILIYFKDNEKAQSGVEALDWAGDVKPYNGDYLLVVDTNFAGAKSDLFIKRFVGEDITIAGDGSVTKTVTLEYKNPAPPSNCDPEAGRLCLNAILRNWIRVYVPQGSKLLSASGGESPKDDGSPMEMVAKEDLGKTVFNGYTRVRPQSSSKLQIKYMLPFKVDRAKPYTLLIQKQPGTDDSEYTVSVNGKEKEKFKLLKDQEVKIAL